MVSLEIFGFIMVSSENFAGSSDIETQTWILGLKFIAF